MLALAARMKMDDFAPPRARVLPAGPFPATMMPVGANPRHTHIRHIHRGCPVS